MKIHPFVLLLPVLAGIHCKQDNANPETVIRGMWKATTLNITVGEQSLEVPLILDPVRLEAGTYEYGPANQRMTGTYQLSADNSQLTITGAQGDAMVYEIIELNDQVLELMALRQNAGESYSSEPGRLALTAINLGLLRKNDELDQSQLANSEMTVILGFSKS
ncbi:MAG: hypothetical protein R2806_01735 [Saprospiraceae bacterium]